MEQAKESGWGFGGGEHSHVPSSSIVHHINNTREFAKDKTAEHVEVDCHSLSLQDSLLLIVVATKEEGCEGKERDPACLDVVCY